MTKYKELRLKIAEISNEIEDKLKSSESYKELSIEDLADMTLHLSGQKRSTIFEKFFQEKWNMQRLPSKEDLGDFKYKEQFFELKTGVINEKKSKAKAFSAGQIRLWQPVDFYLFVSIIEIEEGVKVLNYKIPKKILIDLIKEEKISYSSSHIKGKSSNKRETFMEIEIGVEAKHSQYDWNQFLIDISEL